MSVLFDKPMIALMVIASLALSGCGLAGLDAYGEVDPCPGQADPVLNGDGSFTCKIEKRLVVTGELSPDHPQTVSYMTGLANRSSKSVLYTDGKTARTFAPSPNT